MLDRSIPTNPVQHGLKSRRSESRCQSASKSSTWEICVGDGRSDFWAGVPADRDLTRIEPAAPIAMLTSTRRRGRIRDYS